MSTLQEIKTAIAQLAPREKAILTAELFASEPEPDTAELEAALDRGLRDVEAGRVRPIEDVRAMIPGMDYKVLITDSALADLREIVEFIAEDDPHAAARLAKS